ncbi:uncharacterized protein LOC142169636 [Nicotiana tabacum]|uniref:Uncharacterized protein LOC142169636 n=1 Tax=Nicotiana tabacum TaxID=4097 RepID=A0AC58SRM5_TOBAC
MGCNMERVGEVTYRLAFPPNIEGIHLVFYVSIIHWYHEDKLYVLDFSTIQLDENLNYEEEPIAIIDQQVQKLTSKEIHSIKVLWKGKTTKEATWESDFDMMSRYPHLFTNLGLYDSDIGISGVPRGA